MFPRPRGESLKDARALREARAQFRAPPPEQGSDSDSAAKERTVGERRGRHDPKRPGFRRARSLVSVFNPGCRILAVSAGKV